MTQRQAQSEGFPSLTDPLTRESAPLFVENLLRGEKPREEWMCGVEFELFGYDRARSLERIDAAQVQGVLAGFAPSSRDLVYEGGTVIEAAFGSMSRMTVEPGGQVEFSGAPRLGSIRTSVSAATSSSPSATRDCGLTEHEGGAV